MATDEPDSYFARAWQSQLPDFPTDKEAYDDLSFRRDFEIFRDPPLVPYDVKGYNKKVESFANLRLLSRGVVT